MPSDASLPPDDKISTIQNVSPQNIELLRYKCSHPGCTKTFASNGHLSRHTKVHSGAKPFRCPIPDCESTFARQDNMKQHYRSHVHRLLESNDLEFAVVPKSKQKRKFGYLNEETLDIISKGRITKPKTSIGFLREPNDLNDLNDALNLQINKTNPDPSSHNLHELFASPQPISSPSISNSPTIHSYPPLVPKIDSKYSDPRAYPYQPYQKIYQEKYPQYRPIYSPIRNDSSFCLPRPYDQPVYQYPQYSPQQYFSPPLPSSPIYRPANYEPTELGFDNRNESKEQIQGSRSDLPLSNFRRPENMGDHYLTPY
ncbi:hypothetical protein HK096_002797 [Nowakowskiella sp. JEL0078]|nr:hypothetical protein HK096_002797 [Nowakowskiella sp. JEL0078]